MMAFRTIFYLFLCVYISFDCRAQEYNCPETPRVIKVGEVLEYGWYIWPLNEAWSDWKKKDYLKKEIKYSIRKWNAFPHGWFEDTSEDKNFVACCRMDFKTKKTICAYKDIPEKYCLEKVIGVSKKKFICDNKPIDKKLGDSPFHIKS